MEVSDAYIKELSDILNIWVFGGGDSKTCMSMCADVIEKIELEKGDK